MGSWESPAVLKGPRTPHSRWARGYSTLRPALPGWPFCPLTTASSLLTLSSLPSKYPGTPLYLYLREGCPDWADKMWGGEGREDPNPFICLDFSRINPPGSFFLCTEISSGAFVLVLGEGSGLLQQCKRVDPHQLPWGMGVALGVEAGPLGLEPASMHACQGMLIRPLQLTRAGHILPCQGILAHHILDKSPVPAASHQQAGVRVSHCVGKEPWCAGGSMPACEAGGLPGQGPQPQRLHPCTGSAMAITFSGTFKPVTMARRALRMLGPSVQPSSSVLVCRSSDPHQVSRGHLASPAGRQVVLGPCTGASPGLGKEGLRCYSQAAGSLSDVNKVERLAGQGAEML